MRNYLFCTLALFVAIHASGQETVGKIVPFLKTGGSYLNEEFMIDGSALFAEPGIRLSNGYFFSLQFQLGETVNDIAQFPGMESIDFNFIYTWKMLTLFIGYELTSKNNRHSFAPRMGPCYARQDITYPSESEVYPLILVKSYSEFIGINLALEYLYNFRNGISLGVQTSGYLAYQYGPLFFTAGPVLCFRLK
ncbi:MAG TPA: hypothetical protein PLK12_02515 [Prolixibacteraceae bacterium]|nr:hypothetical protein [Prolixibacteraceae bacterium]